MNNSLHQSVSNILTDCAATRKDLVEISASVNSVVTLLKVVIQHIDNRKILSVGDCNDVIKVDKKVTVNEFDDKLKDMNKIFHRLFKYFTVISEIS
jgi:hypothetical protein